MIRAAVFDLDGTLADTIGTITYYGNRAMERFGLAPFLPEQYKYFVGNGYELLIRRMLEAARAYSEALFAQMKAFYHDDYETDSMYLTKAYPGVLALIDALKRAGIKLGVLSNKPHGAVCDVVRALFGNAFDCVQGQTAGTTLKPDPALLFSMLDGFGVLPEHCLYVGDTATDIKTGKNAGAFTVGVTWGFRKEDELLAAGADRIVFAPEEIAALAGV